MYDLETNVCMEGIQETSGKLSRDEADFRLLMNQDACATEKTAEALA